MAIKAEQAATRHQRSRDQEATLLEEFDSKGVPAVVSGG